MACIGSETFTFSEFDNLSEKQKEEYTEKAGDVKHWIKRAFAADAKIAELESDAGKLFEQLQYLLDRVNEKMSE